MDPEDFPAFLDKLYTTTDSRLRLLELHHDRSASHSSRMIDLNDNEITTELQRVRASEDQPIAESCQNGPFVLLSVFLLTYMCILRVLPPE